MAKDPMPCVECGEPIDGLHYSRSEKGYFHPDCDPVKRGMDALIREVYR